MKTRTYFLILLALLPLLIFRDFTPDNELRYLSIADEALENGTLFTFTNHGEPYADKPPLYLWGVMLGKLLLGTHSLLFLGLFSVVPALVLLYLMDKWVTAEEPVGSGRRLSGVLMLATTAYFIGSGVVLRMDMLMCMFIVLALFTFYRSYRGEGSRWDGFLFPFYVFMALFTKGPVGILVPLVSVVTFLVVKRDFRSIPRYWGWKTWGILLLFSLVWFAGVLLEGGREYLDNLLVNQTVNRAVDSFHHKAPFYYYLVAVWYILAPWSLLYIGTILLGVTERLIRTDLRKFFLVVILTTLVMLSLISGKIQIYLLPAFPFFTYLALLLLPEIRRRGWVKLFIALPAALLVLVLPALAVAVASGRAEAQWLFSPFIYIGGAVLSAAALLALWYLYQRDNLYGAVNRMATGILVALFALSFAVPAFNPWIGYGAFTRKGLEIASERGLNRFYYYKVKRPGNMDVYLHTDPLPLTLEELEQGIYGDGILFVREKEVEREPELKSFIEGKEQYQEGKHRIIVL